MVDDLIGTYCVCNNITYKEIQHIVHKHENIKTIKDLQQYCNCANKCSLCKPDIEKIIKHFTSTRELS